MAARTSWSTSSDASRVTWSSSTTSLSGDGGRRAATANAGNRFLREVPRREGECSLFVKYSSPSNPMVDSIPMRYLPRSGDPAHAHAVFPQFAEVSDSCVAPSLVAPRPLKREIIQSRPASVKLIRSPLRTSQWSSRTFLREPNYRTTKTGTLTDAVRPKFAASVWQPATTSPVGKGAGWTFHPSWTGA